MISVVAEWVPAWQWYFCVALSGKSAATPHPPSPPLLVWFSSFPWPHPPLSGFSSLAAGANLEWHGERVQWDSVPLHHKITWSPPHLFFQGFRLAKSGLMRAAFTCHHHHIHKSSCCFPTSVSEVLNFPSPSSTSPLKVQRAWDQVRMPLWFSPPPLWLPFYVRGHFVFWFPILPHPPLSLNLSPCGCWWFPKTYKI